MGTFVKSHCILLQTGLAVMLAMGVCAGAAAENLYKPNTYQALASDVRARRPGDLITVMVYENASASSTADTSAGRDASVGVGLNRVSKAVSAGITTSSSTDGRGRTQREGKVLAQITVTVKEVGANGDLLIGGEQLLEINDEKQRIYVEGRIRPQDIMENNAVMSTRIANARIRYIGQGDLSDRQRPAWWQRFLTWFGV
jgi:flagellar L-ring protein precursor FlgH